MQQLKSIVKAICLSGIALLSVNAFAGPNRAIEEANSQLSLSTTSQTMTYHELDTTGFTGGPYLDSETGVIPGYTLTWKGQGKFLDFRDIYAEASFHAANGSTDYDGYLQDNQGNIVAPYRSLTGANITDMSIRIGKVVPTGPVAQIVPFLGYDTHQWVRTLAPPYGYQETYRHNSVNFGLMGQLALTPELVLSATGFVGAMQDAAMKVTGGSNYTLVNQSIKTLELTADYKVAKHWHLSAVLGSTEFSYGRSPVVDGAYEPDSRTKTDYFNFGVGYHF